MFRKTILCLSALLVSFNAFAGSVDYLSQQSSDYLRILSKNGSLEGADLISYNPAGTAFLTDGWHLQISNQSFFKSSSVEAPTPGEKIVTKYESTKPTYAIPSVFAIYKKDNWNAFASVTVPAGGGSQDYKDGIHAMLLLETGYQQAYQAAINNPHAKYYFAKLKDGSFEGNSIYMGYTIGSAFALNEMVSFSLAARYLTAEKTYLGHGDFYIVDGYPPATVIATTSGDLDCEKTAEGLGAIVGVDVKVNEQLNFGLKYETRTKLEFESSSKPNAWDVLPPMASFKDGAKQRKDLPAMLSVGANYTMFDKYTVSGGMNYFFIKDADQGTSDGLNDSYDDGYELQLGFDYKMLDNLKISTGYNYVKVGGNSDTYNDFEFQLDSHFLALGAKYQLNEMVDISTALNKVFYTEGEGKDTYAGAKYNKDVIIYSIGAGFHL